MNGSIREELDRLGFNWKSDNTKIALANNDPLNFCNLPQEYTEVDHTDPMLDQQLQEEDWAYLDIHATDDTKRYCMAENTGGFTYIQTLFLDVTKYCRKEVN